MRVISGACYKRPTTVVNYYYVLLNLGYEILSIYYFVVDCDLPVLTTIDYNLVYERQTQVEILANCGLVYIKCKQWMWRILCN